VWKGELGDGNPPEFTIIAISRTDEEEKKKGDEGN